MSCLECRFSATSFDHRRNLGILGSPRLNSGFLLSCHIKEAGNLSGLGAHDILNLGLLNQQIKKIIINEWVINKG